MRDGSEPVTFVIEVDACGDGSWKRLRDIAVPAHGSAWTEFTAAETGAWVRLTASRDAPKATAFFHYRADDGKCAVWVGTVDDLWALGKPRGTGGPWRDTAVKAGVPSDACLATGYDQKRLTLSHTSSEPVTFRVEADFTGTGTWAEVARLTAPPGKPLEHRFPDAFGAYWLRFIADKDTTATATLIYQ